MHMVFIFMEFWSFELLDHILRGIRESIISIENLT